MNNYKILDQIGGGSFGIVWRALHCPTGTVVAIKRMRQQFRTWNECLQLKEVQVLQKIQHPSIVKLFEVIREDERLFLVFEFFGNNMYQAIKDRNHPLPEAIIRVWLKQVLQGLHTLHSNGFYHRDIKPENILIKGKQCKIADLGLAQDIDPQLRSCTTYVSTRWYRAPEILLRCKNYGPKIDLFAVGVVAAELYALKPLFPGRDEIDMIACITKVLGPPTVDTWPNGVRLALSMGFEFPTNSTGVSFSNLLPTASPSAIDLIQSLCQWNPSARPTAEEALNHPYFFESSNVPLLGNASFLSSQLAAAAMRISNSQYITDKKTLQQCGAVFTTQNASPLRRLSYQAQKRQRASIYQQKGYNIASTQ